MDDREGRLASRHPVLDAGRRTTRPTRAARPSGSARSGPRTTARASGVGTWSASASPSWRRPSHSMSSRARIAPSRRVQPGQLVEASTGCRREQPAIWSPCTAGARSSSTNTKSPEVGIPVGVVAVRRADRRRWPRAPGRTSPRARSCGAATPVARLTASERRQLGDDGRRAPRRWLPQRSEPVPHVHPDLARANPLGVGGRDGDAEDLAQPIGGDVVGPTGPCDATEAQDSPRRSVTWPGPAPPDRYRRNRCSVRLPAQAQVGDPDGAGRDRRLVMVMINRPSGSFAASTSAARP